MVESRDRGAGAQQVPGAFRCWPGEGRGDRGFLRQVEPVIVVAEQEEAVGQATGDRGCRTRNPGAALENDLMALPGKGGTP